MPDPITLSSLRTLVAARFPTATRKHGARVPTGVAALDAALGGGLPAGLLTELVSNKPGAGGQLVFARLLGTTRAARQRIALVDAADAFCPDSVPPDHLRHLVWVRPQRSACRVLGSGFWVLGFEGGSTVAGTPEPKTQNPKPRTQNPEPSSLSTAFAAADILVRDGNYAAIVIDLRGIPEHSLRRMPATPWHRLHRSAETHPAAILIQTPFALVPSVPWRLHLSRSEAGQSEPRTSNTELRTPNSAGRTQDRLAAELAVEITRGHEIAAEEQAG